MSRFHEHRFHELRIRQHSFWHLDESRPGSALATSLTDGQRHFSYMVESGHACDGPDLTTFSFRPDPVLAHPRQRL